MIRKILGVLLLLALLCCVPLLLGKGLDGIIDMLKVVVFAAFVFTLAIWLIVGGEEC